MIEQIDPLKKELFNTSNGERDFFLKSYDGCEVPFGYYYESDLQEKWYQLNKLLTNSVFPLLYRLIDEEIPKYFTIDDMSFNAEVFAGPYKKYINGDSLDDSLKKVVEEFDFHNSLSEDFFINIEFETLKENGENKKYGCQILITNGSEIIQDIEEVNDFIIWYLYLGGEKTIIDSYFTLEQENNIIEYFLGNLKKSEESFA